MSTLTLIWICSSFCYHSTEMGDSFLLCRYTAHRCHHWHCQRHYRDMAHSVDSQCIPAHIHHIVNHSSLHGRYSHQRAVKHNKLITVYLATENKYQLNNLNMTSCNTHTRLTALCPGLPGWAGTRKEKPIWILLKQETVSGSGIRWAICKSAPRSRQITMPAPHHSVFYRPDALPATQPTVSKHWRNCTYLVTKILNKWASRNKLISNIKNKHSKVCNV